MELFDIKHLDDHRLHILFVDQLSFNFPVYNMKYLELILKLCLISTNLHIFNNPLHNSIQTHDDNINIFIPIST
jgi:hypothetical protein